MSNVCTLYEGQYHIGVAAWINSLCAHDFNGTVWVGFRGELPSWAIKAKKESEYFELRLTPAVRVCFIPVHTELHLTNYKPDFMLMLMEHFCPTAEHLFYFDPDIVVKCRWSFFEEWVSYGIALVEDLHSPMNPLNPLRFMWKSFYKPHGFEFIHDHAAYVNAGFLGVKRADREFLQLWRSLNQLMPGDPSEILPFPHRSYPFRFADQDVLNVVLCCTTLTLSIVDSHGMDFTPGGYLMSHAAGQPKPWDSCFIRRALIGKAPTFAARNFFRNTRGPIKVFHPIVKFAKVADLLIGRAISAFIRQP